MNSNQVLKNFTEKNTIQKFNETMFVYIKRNSKHDLNTQYCTSLVTNYTTNTDKKAQTKDTVCKLHQAFCHITSIKIMIFGELNIYKANIICYTAKSVAGRDQKCNILFNVYKIIRFSLKHKMTAIMYTVNVHSTLLS